MAETEHTTDGGAPAPSGAPAPAGDRPVKIIGIVCNWCSYAGADTAGVGRFRQPANLRLIRVPCTGRIDPLFALKAFEKGADGVLISGCHPGDCHYINGNWRTAGRYPMLQKLLEQLGMEPGRIRLEWVSAAEGDKWARVVTEFCNEIKELGPLGWKDQIVDEYQPHEAEEAVTA